MTRPITIDPAAPYRSLVDVAAARGVTIAELARRLGVRGPSIFGYIDSGARVQLSTLQAAAEAIGVTIDMRAKDSP